MIPRLSDDQQSLSLDQLAHEIYESLARRFPICLGSDEFHFFPHYRSRYHDWSMWDDFSPDSVAEVTTQIKHWESLLVAFSSDPLRRVKVGATALTRLLRTIREQLALVRFHETQPTFYLTIVVVGLVEALDVSVEVFSRRVAGLPDFLRRALTNLDQLPQLYGELGLEMADKIHKWLAALPRQSLDCRPALDAVQKFMAGLKSMEPREDFLLSSQLYEHVVEKHIDCHASLSEIEDQLIEEIEETESLMTKSAHKLCPGTSWQKVLADLPCPSQNHADPSKIYEEVIDELYNHCHRQKFIAGDFTKSHRVKIKEIPDCMGPVRSDAAFSMPPGYPPGTGLFYILPSNSGSGIPVDYRLLSAHETYPGHQLLDSSRWMLPNVVQRPIEFPIFYEGWASFSEEILFETGFFSGTVDQLLMAKRRYWRAQRGLIDLRIHSGRCDLSTASGDLAAKGLSPAVSRDMVRRYALKPGYQLAYTIGRQRFNSLYSSSKARGRPLDVFVRQVLSAGEICFDDLARLLNDKEEEN